MEDGNGDGSSTGLSSNPSSNLEKKVVEWLNSQGYPLEMHTAKCCRDAGLTTQPSYYYFDGESGKQRETDVYGYTREMRATKKGRNFQLSFAFECKQSRAKPWVAFTHTHMNQDDISLHRATTVVQRICPKYTEDWWLQLATKAIALEIYPLENINPIAHSLVRVSFDKSREDAAFAALMSVAKAATDIADTLGQGSKNLSRKVQLAFTIVIPVLVLDAPLFSCHLDDEDEVSLSPIDRCTLHWSNQVSSESPGITIIEVVTKQSLPNFLNDMNTALEQISDLALKPL